MRFKTIALWTTAPLTGLILYWPGLMAWFQKDDFAWLGLYQMMRSRADVWTVLFHPYAQGTVRTLSERMFYTSFFAMFGMNALPYRMLAFLTYLAATILITAVCTKLTGSQAAGCWAALFWTLNGCLAYAMSWTAIYYELLCTVVFLSALWLLIRYEETTERRFLIGQWVIYLLGFGVLEQNVVYPAIATAYAFCCAPRMARKVWPMYIPALIYSALHIWATPLQSDGPYKMSWDASMFGTLGTYWKLAMGPSRLILFHIHPSRARSSLTVLLTIGLLGFLVHELRQKRRLTLFFAGWFVIVLAPLLPLRDHISEYYLTIPLVGLAMWGAWALVCAWRSGLAARIAATGLTVIYLSVAIPLARVAVVSFYDRSQQIRDVVERVVTAAREHPATVILLKNVDREMYWSGIYHRPFRLYGIEDVYLLPENRKALEPFNAWDNVESYFSTPAQHPGAIVVDLGKRPRDYQRW